MSISSGLSRYTYFIILAKAHRRPGYRAACQRLAGKVLVFGQALEVCAVLLHSVGLNEPAHYVAQSVANDYPSRSPETHALLIGPMRLMSKREIREFYRRLAETRPIPQTELEYINPFTLLVAVVLSAQATDVGVNRATVALFALADTPQAMLALGEERLIELIRTIGLFRTKAKNVMALSRMLVERHHGEVPRDRAALEALPGVGRKTASVVLNVAFGEPTIAVDTHIFRVGNRTGLAPGKTPLEVEMALEKRTPREYKARAHHWLILHGRYVCKARKPDCPVCVVADLCHYGAKTGPAELAAARAAAGEPAALSEPQTPAKPAVSLRRARASRQR
jgi:endonuclease-3